MNYFPKRDAELFAELLQVPSDQRDAYLMRACGDDNALRQRLGKLLEANDELGDFLDKPFHKMLEKSQSAASIGGKPGNLIGRYKLLEQIGEGGCGVVFMAVQKEPVRRRVALKIIKPGMDTKSVIARFEAERQALALMDHPNIARIFDAGATESGRPYFVMELVRGIKITEYCDQHSLATEERLKLFIQVCQAVQHAHQKGIIHRDIKPSNILVTTTAVGVPLPVVIDFGVAKATNNQKLTDKTIFTAFEMLVGTPAYMSPEQATLASADVDTRTDIYSLGVLLYELLTSSTPFETEELQKIGLDEMRRKIREQEPVRPSTRLTKMREIELTMLAKRRGSEAPALIRLVRGDLDWIVMKALEKARTRRYQTAYSMALDVQHFLANEPVSARPPSSVYKFQKMVIRNKFLFLGMGLIIVLFIVSLIVVSISLAREQRAHREAVLALQQVEKEKNQVEAEKNQATSEAARSQQITQFLEDMLQGVGPSVARGRDTTMLREILDQTEKRISTGLTNQPEVEAQMRNLIGGLYLEIGNYEKAEESQRAAVAIERELRGPESTELATSLHVLSMALDREGKLAEAESAELEALAIRRHVLGEQSSDVSDSLNNLASIWTDEGRLAEAESLCRETLAARKKMFGEYSLPVADSLHALYVVLCAENKKAECEATARERLAICEKILGTNDVTVASALYDAAYAVDSNGKTAEAESLGVDDLKIRRKLLGDLHPDVATSLSFLGQIMEQRGQMTESEVVLTAAYTIQCKLQGQDSPDALYALDAIGMTLNNENKWKEAESIYNKSFGEWRKLQGNTGPRTLWALQGLMTALTAQHKYSDADRLLAEVLTPAFLKDPACADILAYRRDLLARQGKWSEGLTDATLVVKYQPTDYYCWHTFAELLAITGNRAAYETSCPKILAMFANTTNPYINVRVADDCLFLPNSNADLNIVDKLADKAVSLGNGWSDEPYFQVTKAMSAYRLRHYTEAIEWAQKTLKGSIIYPNADAYAILAMANWELGQKDVARMMLDKGNSLTPDISPSDKAVDLGDSWTAWVEARLSLDEAAALIQLPETQASSQKP